MQEKDKEEYYKKQKSFENTNKKIGNIYGGNSLQKSSTTFYDTDTLVENTLNNGRFPANTILTYDETDFDEVCGGFPDTKNTTKTHIAKNSDNNVNFNASKEVNIIGYNDNGSAARYFYNAKASKKDRDEGLDEFETKQCVGGGGGIGNYLDDVNSASGKFGSEKAPHKNTHPTVKPTELMQYLVRLVTPKGGTILDPFTGSGTTGKAVAYENKERKAKYKFIGIELSPEYVKIAEARISHAIEDYYDYSSENTTMENIQTNIDKKIKTSDKVLLW